MKRILAFFLVAAILFAVTACSQGSDVKGDKDQTAIGTEIPSAEPTIEATEEPPETTTEEPTETPLPEDWYIDPNGIIPSWVEILVPDDSENPWCLTRVDGKATLQQWDKSGLLNQWQVPEDTLNGKWISASYGVLTQGFLHLTVYLTDELWNGTSLLYYETIDEKYMCFEISSSTGTNDLCILGTTDGKIVIYRYGEASYEMYDPGEGSEVFVFPDGNCIINGEHIPTDKMKFVEVPLKEKDF